MLNWARLWANCGGKTIWWGETYIFEILFIKYFIDFTGKQEMMMWFHGKKRLLLFLRKFCQIVWLFTKVIVIKFRNLGWYFWCYPWYFYYLIVFLMKDIGKNIFDIIGHQNSDWKLKCTHLPNISSKQRINPNWSNKVFSRKIRQNDIYM